MMRQSVRGVVVAVAVSAAVVGCRDATAPPGGVAGSAIGANSGAAAGSGPVAGVSAAAGVSGAAGMSAAAGKSAGAAGCGSESFAAIYQSILADKNYNCSGALCHGRDAAGLPMVGNLSLSNAQVAYMQLVGKSSDSAMCAGKPRVVPGDAKGSLLIQKLRGDTTVCGAPMPVAADEITDDQLKRITDWINGGACDN
jgi:hypothetical protein